MQIMVNDQVAVFVQLVLPVAVFDIDIITGVVLAAFFADRKEDGVVINFGTKFVVPFLHKQNTGFGAGVGLEGVAVQTRQQPESGRVGR